MFCSDLYGARPGPAGGFGARAAVRCGGGRWPRWPPLWIAPLGMPRRIVSGAPSSRPGTVPSSSYCMRAMRL
ncbi:hypothetical protein, partial [Streptomyces sp. sk2.1]|uniref:hypothetical protein n=1 Tax=Streptomyces sp. sk2.1 TaxID=2478959 RepID=UPI001CA3509E